MLRIQLLHRLLDLAGQLCILLLLGLECPRRLFLDRTRLLTHLRYFRFVCGLFLEFHLGVLTSFELDAEEEGCNQPRNDADQHQHSRAKESEHWSISRKSTRPSHRPSQLLLGGLGDACRQSTRPLVGRYSRVFCVIL